MKKFLFSGICVLAIVTVAVLNIKLIGRMGVLLQPIIAISVVLVLIVTDVIRVLLR